jgi:putative tryptophan/tyrosine transport system substrate-binding protein
MRRREFIAGLGGAVAWPLAARAQQPLPVIGYFNPAFDSRAIGIVAFRQGLGELGFVEGKNLTIEYRNAEGQVDRLSAFAAEFVHRPVAVIAATGGNLPALAAKAATSIIPIVFVGAENPVELGLVPRFNRPGGNITGITLYALALSQKRVELLSKLVPNASVIALLVRPTNRGGTGAAEPEIIDVPAAANALGLRCHVVTATSPPEIDAAFATLTQLGVGALHVSADLLFVTQREQIFALAARDRIPTSF